MTSTMMTSQEPTPSTEVLSAWLKAVSSHLAVRRFESREGVPCRNRERERARRQARKLFRDYDRTLALAQTVEQEARAA